jgi:hypothetical protein
MPWRTIGGEDLAPASLPQLQSCWGRVREAAAVDLVRHFNVLRTTSAARSSRRCRLSPVHAVNRAIAETVAAQRAAGRPADRPSSGTRRIRKSDECVFYAGRVILHRRWTTDAGRPDGPERPGLSAFRPVPRAARTAAAVSRCRRPAGPTCGPAPGRIGRGRFTTIRVLPEGQDDRQPCSRTGGTSTTSPTRPTAASTT